MMHVLYVVRFRDEVEFNIEVPGGTPWLASRLA